MAEWNNYQRLSENEHGVSSAHYFVFAGGLWLKAILTPAFQQMYRESESWCSRKLHGGDIEVMQPWCSLEPYAKEVFICEDCLAEQNVLGSQTCVCHRDYFQMKPRRLLIEATRVTLTFELLYTSRSSLQHSLTIMSCVVRVSEKKACWQTFHIVWFLDCLRFEGSETTWYVFGKDCGSWSKEENKFTIGSLGCVDECVKEK